MLTKKEQIELLQLFIEFNRFEDAKRLDQGLLQYISPKHLDYYLSKLEEEYNKKLRQDFWEFCKNYDPKFFTEGKQHLKAIARELQDISEGRQKLLAVSIAPRAGKSYIVSCFCGWLLGKDPLGSIMRNTYTAKLAEKFSKDIRDGVMQSQQFKKVFPEIKSISGNIDAWGINGRTQPAYFCAGVGGSIVGFGCKTLAILDDPIKGIEEAMSETIIEKTWNWYTADHLSRLESGCPELHIATRWSRKDPIGRLTDSESEVYSPDMKVICIPALDDNGESFCEEIKTTDEYLRTKEMLDDYIWESEYMQRPIEKKGLLFPIEDLNRFSLSEIEGKKPDGIIGFTDTADKGKDFLCSIIGRVYGNEVYVSDIIYTQDGVEITEPLTAQMIIDSNAYMMKIESNNGGDSFARNVRKLIEGKSNCMLPTEHQSQNKETRILMKSAYIKKNFYFRNDYKIGSDYDRYMRALTSYVRLGKNSHDDAPDATTGLAEYAETMIFSKPKPKPSKQFTFYDEPEYKDHNYGDIDQSYINY